MRLASRKSIVTGLLALVMPVLVAHSQTVSLEYQVKASYLYNFAQFVSWPSDAFGGDSRFHLCVFGAERFGNALDSIAGERVQGHEIVVQRLDRESSPRTMRCHLVFLAAGITDTVTLGERGMLTVGETPGFLGRGGVINLIQVQGRVRFEINQQAARQAGLVVSSRILNLAVNKP
jgi:hypothetical protein